MSDNVPRGHITDAVADMDGFEDVAGPARFAVVMRRPADARVLAESLDSECLMTPPDGPLPGEIDLIIADLPSLRERGEEIRALRALDEGALIPLLLTVSPQQFDSASQFLGELVDDVVRTPVSRLELTARVKNLLRLRRMNRARDHAMRLAQSRLAGTERALRALSATNEHVIRARDAQDLLERVCEALTTQGEYHLAWVGIPESSGEYRIRPIAQYGDDLEYVDELQVTWAGGPQSTGPAGRAVMEQRSQVVNDFLGDSDTAPWHEAAREYGIHSAMCLPLSVDGLVDFVLCIYSTTRDAFDRSECELLERLASNLTFGLASIREHQRRIASERQAVRIARRDALTGLANRAAAVDALEELERNGRAESRDAALLFVDLDGFKLVNDALGHDRGDELLTEVGRRLRRCVRDGDRLARQGGDEFLVLVNHDRNTAGELRDTAAQIARRLIDVLSEPMQVGGAEYRVGASVGISLFPHDAERPTDLLACADSAMYLAKKQGGSRFQFFSRDLAQRQQRRLSLEQRLRDAVDGDALEAHFQPIFELVDGSTVGVEALARWPQPDGDFISPGEFIPVAEDTGMILPMGRRIFELSVHALAEWRAAGYPVRAAVNLSVSQFLQPGFVKQLVDIVECSGLTCDLIDTELTESDIVTDVERMETAVHELGEAGFAIAIDDFGTGYSSLGRLKSLPIDKLKIDKSFLHDVPSDADSTTLIRGIATLGHSLGMGLVAEGVEHRSHWEFLRALGCEWGQGFYFARPMPGADMTARLREEFGSR